MQPSEGVIAQAMAQPEQALRWMRPWVAAERMARARDACPAVPSGSTTRISCRDGHFAMRRRADPSARSGSRGCADPDPAS